MTKKTKIERYQAHWFSIDVTHRCYESQNIGGLKYLGYHFINRANTFSRGLPYCPYVINDTLCNLSGVLRNF
jgi:hypothetical protein